MLRSLRLTLGGAALLALAACAKEGVAPTTPDAADLAAAAIDPDAAAIAGQASMPGLTMEPATTYQGDARAADQCAWSAEVSRIVCAPVTRNGLTFTRSIAFYDAAGTSQQRRDASTVKSNTQITVKGTTTTDRGSFTVDRASDLTVSGLGRDATTHTLNGTESGTTTGSMKIGDVSATSKETFSSTTKDVVVPVPQSRGTWPLSGSVTRSTTMTVTRGDATRTMSHSETVTFTGTSVVKVTITHDGVTKSCTRDLAARTQSCS